MTGCIDKYCNLDDGKLFQDFHCVLTQVDEEKNTDKFYLIQLLTNDDGYYVWTRWGRNGTRGQSKLEGPIQKLAAIENFKKKFQDKTKNKWENRSNFVPAKRKYRMLTYEVRQSSANEGHQSTGINSASLDVEKPILPDTVISGKALNVDVLYQIMFFLSTKDVLRCMQVCKFWKAMLSQKYFWKELICHQFDLALTSDYKDDYTFYSWSNPEEWYCYYENEEDAYVIRPFPSMWKCRVVHPCGLEPMSGDVKSLQGFCRSLEILTYMRKGVKTFDIASGHECSGSEGEHDISVVLFPWHEDELPGATTILTQIFHFHPEICEYFLNNPDQGIRRDKKLDYHLPSKDDDDVPPEFEEQHDIDEKPCLNQIFGFGSIYTGNEIKLPKAKKFYAWLQKIMVPTITVIAGDDKLNPVVVFFITKLAQGWAGGVLTGVTYT